MSGSEKGLVEADGRYNASVGGALQAVFYGQLASLLEAGMPFPTALRALARDARASAFRAALERAAEGIESGVPPGEALKKEEKQLGSMLARITVAAAASGKLAGLLSALSAWTMHQERLKRHIRDALAYPFMVLFLTSALSIAGFWFVTMSDWMGALNPDELGFQRDDKLMMITVITWGMSATVFSVLLLHLFFWFLAWLSHSIRRLRETAMIRLPVFGAVCRPIALSRFCGSIAVLLKADVPMHEAVGAAGRLTEFAPYERASREAAAALAAGATPTDAMKNANLFPGTLRFILKSAEQRGDLPEAFEELGELYRWEAEGRSRLVALLCPPVFFIAVATIIGFSIYTLLFPFLQIMNNLGCM